MASLNSFFLLPTRDKVQRRTVVRRPNLWNQRGCFAVNVSDVRALTNGNPVKHFAWRPPHCADVRVRSRKDMSNFKYHPNLIHKISFEMEQSNQSESEFCTYTEVHFDWFSGRQCQLWDSKMLIDIVQASSYLGQIVKREKKSKFVVAGETPVGGFNP